MGNYYGILQSMARIVRKAPAQDRQTGKFVSENDGIVVDLTRGQNGNKTRVVNAVGRKTRVQVPVGGLSLIGIDPGKTTGLAVWDAWDKRWYVDQLDAGRGRKVRLKVHGGFIESAALIDGADELGLRLATGYQLVRGGGIKKKLAIDAIVERTVVQTLLDVILAVGPRCIVVCEDFVLGHAGGRGLTAVEIGRDGLSPVRINARLEALMEAGGFYNGDAWRTFTGHWWTGGDDRGVSILNNDACTGKPISGVPEFRKRLTRVEQWRLGEVVTKRGYGAVWGGGGVQFETRLPSQRLWMGDSKTQEQWMKDEQVWMQGRPHGMVALQHAHAVGRTIGLDDLGDLDRIWAPAAKVRSKGITAKSATS